MSFVALTNEELEAVRQHHDMLIQMGELELQAEEIRESCPAESRQQKLQPIEQQIHKLDEVITHLPG